MSTGDLKNNVKQLVNELKTIKYGKTVDTELIVSGSAKAYLSIYNYLFTTYNSKFNADIVNSNNELYGKSDLKFMEAVYRILRDMFDYKAKITREQFFAPGFSEHKVIMAQEVIRHVRSRYSPPKSARHHNTGGRSRAGSGAVAEKVSQEPTEKPRKVSSKQSFPPSVAAGAIVLPSRPGSNSGGYKIPKSSQGLPGPKHNQERPVFGEPVPVGRQAMSVATNRHKGVEYGEVEPRVIRAKTIPQGDNFSPLPAHNGDSHIDSVTSTSVVPDTDEVEAIVRRKVVDLVSPALLKINERVGVLEITMQDLEEKEKQPERVEPAPSAALINGLSQQMNDVVFKLQTLTSRLTLLENRVTMVETQLNEEASHRMTLFASQSYTQSKKSKGLSQGMLSEDVRENPRSNSAVSNFENSYKPLNKMAVSNRPETERLRDSGNNKRMFQSKAVGSQDGGDCGGELKCVTESGKDVNWDSPGHLGKGEMCVDHRDQNVEASLKTQPALAFMKSLVNPEDCNSLLTTSGVEAPEDLTATETEISAAQKENGAAEPSLSQAQRPALLPPKSTDNSSCQHDLPASNEQRGLESSVRSASHQSKSSKPTVTQSRPPFSEVFSPIRSFSDLSLLGGNQDLSSMLIPGAGYEADESNLVDRRSSTPTGQGGELDISRSTLDRISRIKQMVEATEQLLQ